MLILVRNQIVVKEVVNVMNVKKVFLDNPKYLEDFITRNTYHSNAIEGNPLSYAEIHAIIFNDNDFKISAKPRDIYEAINHKYAIDYILNHLDENLSESIIKDIGKLINKNISEIDGYRKVPVFIKGAEHIPPSPNQLPQNMMYLVYNYNHTNYDSIYRKLADFHIQFEHIHPFEDGNGRTGRLLINFELIKNGMLPIVILKEERSDYFNMIATKDIDGLGRYFERLQDKERERTKEFTIEISK